MCLFFPGGVSSQEMSKAGYKLPLLIGGATTSKMHTAVKISPQYATPEVCLDPSVSVAGPFSFVKAVPEAFLAVVAQHF